MPRNNVANDQPSLPAGWPGRLWFMWIGKHKTSYLEHYTDHNDFTRNGVHYVHWLDVLINVQGRPSIIGPKMLVILVVAAVLTWIVEEDVTATKLDDGIDKDTMAYLTFGLSLLLVFRVGQSYNRYNEARVKWGMMVNRTRDICRQFHTYVDDKKIATRATKWTIAFVYACKQSLRWEKECNELLSVLGASDLEQLNNADHMPVYCMEKLSECIRESLKMRLIDTQTAYMMDRNITSFEDQIGACERILKTPVPYGLVLHLRFLIVLYIICLPLFLVQHLGWGTIPVTLIFAYTLTGLEDISQEIENPFRRAWHALPIDGICQAIQRNLEEIEARNTQFAPRSSSSA